MEGPNLEERIRQSRMEQYLLADERAILAQRQHWILTAEPIASAVAGLALVLALNTLLPARLAVLADALLWAWFALLGRTVWMLLEYRRKWFVATDKRMLVNYGLINQGVAMLSLSRVVDLTYSRSWLGQLLGYGTLIRESAGHNQTLHKVRWVKHPDRTYLIICAAVFGLGDRQRGSDPDDHSPEGGQPSHTSNGYTDFASTGNGHDTAGHPNGIRTQPADWLKNDRDAWQPEPELTHDETDTHEADTGPISY